MRSAYIGLGANLGDPPQQLRTALAQIAGLGRITARSPFYRSAPMGPADQPAFCNAACRLETALAPVELMQALLGIELQMGRQRTIKWGPRMIDLDLLHVDGVECATTGLTLPHPGIAQRNFVLAPLLDIAADGLRIPGIAPLDQALQAIGRDGLELWGG
ncbi:MAG: 2-amino-4-hydroxy-6-hydroxymethyldihydropteridine diphosphokinase [Pseudomonadota bacterium]|nr:2-amino-4-hydroxy-6-hydroxymethyldihydropteridine diphosphokinase [Pseudomonadota bacterium]